MTTTAIRDDYPDVLDGQLHWQKAQVATYSRADGQHISFIVWLDDTMADKPAQLLECKTGRIVALPDIDTAKARVMESELSAGRAVPADEAGVL